MVIYSFLLLLPKIFDLPLVKSGELGDLLALMLVRHFLPELSFLLSLLKRFFCSDLVEGWQIERASDRTVVIRHGTFGTSGSLDGAHHAFLVCAGIADEPVFEDQRGIYRYAS